MLKAQSEIIIQCETSAGFLLHANEFLAAAELVLNRTTGISLPAYFLFGRSIELSLKAYLLGCGMPISELASRKKSRKKFGHDLASLLEEAQRRSLNNIVQLNQHEIEAINLLNFDYKEKRLEYRVTGGRYCLPLIEVTEEVARKLVFNLKTFCTESQIN